MEEIRIYLDEKKELELGKGEIKPIVAGSKESRSIFIENIIKYPINVLVTTDNPKINVTNGSVNIPAGSTKKVDIEFNYDMEEIEPIKLTIKLKIAYTAR